VDFNAVKQRVSLEAVLQHFGALKMAKKESWK
jgi:hypothetical protein